MSAPDTSATTATGTDWALVGDVGATNARFALVDPSGTIVKPRAFPCADYPGIADAIGEYLEDADTPRPQRALIAIAASSTDDVVRMTNHPWTFSISGLRDTLQMRSVRIVNDFVAAAAAIPHLKDDERTQIGSGEPVAGAPIGVLGPGSGLGVSSLVPTPEGPMPIPGEGGHVTMPPADARESKVLDLMRARFDHVSAERLLSGPGLVNIYGALCEISGVPNAGLSPSQITDPASAAEHPCAQEATQMLCAMLGTIAGNLALTIGARGGVYIGGGIIPKLGDRFAKSGFRERFEAKGRFRSYLAPIPTYVVVQPYAALLGASKLLDRS